MRITTVTTCFLILSSAAGSALLNLVRRGQGEEGGGRALIPDVSADSREQSTDDPILPGRSGWYRDPKTGDTNILYGDDWLPGHMRHLDRNQQLYPGNRDLHDINPKSEDNNRKYALKDIPAGPPQQVSGFPTVRDEKLPNLFIKKPGQEDHTTVEYRVKDESDGAGRPKFDHYKGGRTHSGTDYTHESGLLSAAKGKALTEGNGKGRLMSNSGWLSLDPKQRLAHEAPARLGTETQQSIDANKDNKKPGQKPGNVGVPGTTDKVPRGRGKASAQGQENSPSQTFQRERTAGDKTLRTLTSNQPVEEPKTPIQNPPQRDRGKNPNGKTFLTDGTPARPAGEVWRSQAPKQERPPLFGAPIPEKNSDKRQPTRPQNMDAYTKQQEQAKQKQSSDAAAQVKAEDAAKKAGVVPGSESSDKDDKYRKNLQQFNAQHPVQAGRLSSGRPAEAPEPSNRQSNRPVQNDRPIGGHGEESPPTSPPDTPTRMPIRPRPLPGSSTGQNGNTPGNSNTGVIAPSTPPRTSEGPRRNPPRIAKTASRSGQGRLRRRWIIEYLLSQQDL